MMARWTPLPALAAGDGVEVLHNDDRSTLIRLSAGGLPRSSAGAPLGQGRTISLNLERADIHSALRLISEVSGLQFVASDEVKGQVTVNMVDVPWDAALLAILQTQGLQLVPLGPGVAAVQRSPH
jgi:type IV pilus assembly protein PilQ